MPNHWSKVRVNETYQTLKKWAISAVAKNPQLIKKYHKKTYCTGDQVHTFDKTYNLEINHHQKKTLKGKVDDNKIIIFLPNNIDSSEIQPAHISKVLATHYTSFFKQKVIYWNAFFAVTHKAVRLKYNSSNWGSCSTLRNINLSTRLILCPIEVIDYVIVHELAHLIHHNHSARFWNEVKRVMPEYKTHALWLKKEGTHLDF